MELKRVNGSLRYVGTNVLLIAPLMELKQEKYINQENQALNF